MLLVPGRHQAMHTLTFVKWCIAQWKHTLSPARSKDRCVMFPGFWQLVQHCSSAIEFGGLSCTCIHIGCCHNQGSSLVHLCLDCPVVPLSLDKCFMCSKVHVLTMTSTSLMHKPDASAVP